ncbi:endoglucanase [Dysgonomonas sp. GY75]|jgi:mannan endo-1,4-beta-mannosidase|uniref:glycoside hydrolase family 26 protein n=1 Tax=Dysgonomonas sp. GY75 TaxID=2780419 RepID=UPI001883D675|nr:glycosyl hydrolase [Dysgonomonas sp. GY75]MBF0647568.1 endoglucanase [Dysgonomonas sp. GY75]
MKHLLVFTLLTLILLSCKQKEEVENKILPIDKNATKETVVLYNRLFSLMDKGIMVGHQDDLAYGHAWYKEAGRSDVKDVTGDYPAVIGWELGHVETGAEFNLDSIYFSDMKRYIKETYDRGGITTVSWHGDNIVTGNTAWDCAQDSVVRTILPNGSNHEKYLVWLDRVADFFLDLKDKDSNYIPVIFRMYHEHTGAWFWWGSKQCTPDEYKKLWIMTVEYLRDKKNVHNLLYAYSPSETESEEAYLERYPGDEYVDIVGYDSYVNGKSPEDIERYKDAMSRNLKIVTDYASKTNKVPVIGETGMESIPDSTYFTNIVYPIITQHKVAWVLFWRNAWEPDKPLHYYMPYGGHPAAEDLNVFIGKPSILMNRDIN